MFILEWKWKRYLLTTFHVEDGIKYMKRLSIKIDYNWFIFMNIYNFGVFQKILKLIKFKQNNKIQLLEIIVNLILIFDEYPIIFVEDFKFMIYCQFLWYQG